MRHLVFLVLLLIATNSFGQEKRLAWVIGNSNYDEGFLKNPVNDALLVAKTLKELNFTVLLDTNIATYKDFCNGVIHYGEERSNYNIGLIYYAGHGVQINNENYLLATKEEYNEEKNVQYYGVSIQRILDYIKDKSNEVNVLILDACRDNPFEKSWKTTGRSLEGGRGLAKANPPTGSLIAYSTDAGNIAADGTGKNSIYCLSFVKNIQIDDIALPQVFNYVRSDVLKASRGLQRPVEASQLTGEPFYLKKSNFKEKINKIDSLIENKNYNTAILKCGEILSKDTTNKSALIKVGKANYLSNKNYDGIDFIKAINLYPNDIDPYIEFCQFLIYKKQINVALDSINHLIERNPNSTEAYKVRATIYSELNKPKEALSDYDYALSLDSNSYEIYFFKSQLLINHFKFYEQALDNLNKAIILNPMIKEYYFSRGALLSNRLNKREEALKDYYKMLELDSINQKALNAIGVTYKKLGKLDSALKYYNKSIEIGPIQPYYLGLCYQNRAAIYEERNMLDSAEQDYNLAIKYNEGHPGHYYQKAVFLRDKRKNFNEAILNFSLAINKNPLKGYYLERAMLYDSIRNWRLAINDYLIAKSENNTISVIQRVAKCYNNLNKVDSALFYYESGSKLEVKDSIETADFFTAYAKLLFSYKFYNEALNSFNRAITINYNKASYYFEIAIMYLIVPYENEKTYNDNMNIARKNIKKSIELDSLNPTYNFYKYKIDIKTNNINLALKDLDNAIKLSHNKAFYLAERGNYYRSYKKFDLAEKDLNAAIKSDSNLVSTYHYQILLLKDKSQVQDAIKLAERTISKYKNDTVANYLIGEIYLEQKDYLKSLKYFNTALSIMEFGSSYQSQFEEIKMVYLSNTYQKVGQLYQLLGDKELPKEYYTKALEALKDEIRPDKVLKEKELQELINQ